MQNQKAVVHLNGKPQEYILMKPEKYLSREQAAAYIQSKGLPCAKSTLQKYVTTGGGPAFQKFGRAVVYTQENLDEWIESRLSPTLNSSTDISSFL